jgi:hypothetical protein
MEWVSKYGFISATRIGLDEDVMSAPFAHRHWAGARFTRHRRCYRAGPTPALEVIDFSVTVRRPPEGQNARLVGLSGNASGASQCDTEN